MNMPKVTQDYEWLKKSDVIAYPFVEEYTDIYQHYISDILFP